MRVRDFYSSSHCEEKKMFGNLIYDENRHIIFEKGIAYFLDNYMSGNKSEKDLLNDTYVFLRNLYYKESDAIQYGWQKTTQAREDCYLIRRFLNWLGTGCVCQEVNKTIHFSFPGTKEPFVEKVHLIYRDENGHFHAVILFTGTCNRSEKGKSVHTSARGSLYALVAKAALEEQYADISIHLVYLRNVKDSNYCLLERFVTNGQRNSNVLTVNYREFYENGVFLCNAFYSFADEVIHTPLNNGCEYCDYEQFCKTPPVVLAPSRNLVAATEPVASAYTMPEYTKEQLQVVNHVDGPLRVCAGPGSGKTSILVGRIKHLTKDLGIFPDYILAVTFTNEAANELKSRCLSFLDEFELPTICTLHSLAFKILKNHEDLLGFPLKILSDTELLRIIQNLVDVTPPLLGFSYNGEKRNLCLTIKQKYRQYNASENPADFFEKNPQYGDDFARFCEEVNGVIEYHHYLTFDNMITLARQILFQYPDIRKTYQSLYKYVMVDEYQDVNEDQVAMIYLLSEHNNLVVVGDDDQNIYAFRGAKADYMIQFNKIFENAKTVVLSKNFRATKSLVEASQSLIQNNKDRIQKSIVSGNTSSFDALPVVVKAADEAVIDKVIASLLKKGYSYGDIAILSTKNAPLEALHNILKTPTQLMKSFLRFDPLFVFVYSVMRLQKDKNDDKAFVEFINLFGKANLLVRKTGESLYTANRANSNLSVEYSLLQDALIFLQDCKSPKGFLEGMKDTISWSGSDSLDVMFDVMKTNNIRSFEHLYCVMDQMVMFCDERRVNPVFEDAVALATYHDSKGKEWPVVLIKNDYRDEGTEELRRLLYVAITRAKKELYILQQTDSTDTFLQEFQHEVWQPDER